MRLVKAKTFICNKIPKLDVVGSMPISRSNHQKFSTARSLPSRTPAGRSGRLSLDSWTEQHPQILFSPHNQPKTSQSEPVAGRSCRWVTIYPCRPILAVLQNFCRAAWTIRAYYRTATGQSLGNHITKSLPGRRENKDRSSRHVSEGKVIGRVESLRLLLACCPDS